MRANPQVPKSPPKKTKMTLNEAKRILEDAGIDTALRDARIIFEHVGGISRTELVLGGAVPDGSAACEAITKRANREPLEYIIGKAQFYKEEYIVNKSCLIPRDDTETLVDFAVKAIPDGKSFVDLCTGSGCVALSVLKNTRDTSAVAVDISPDALYVAKTNAKILGLSDRVDFVLGDALENIYGKTPFAVLSNPPYVTENEYESLSVECKNEPKIAFVGKDNGLEFYKKITALYKNAIDKEGFIAFEIGYLQAAALRVIAEENQMNIKIIKDLSDNDRVAVLTL